MARRAGRGLIRVALALVAAALCTAPAAAQDYVLALEYENSTEGGEDGASSSSSGRQAIAERIIAAKPDGTELEYTLPFDSEDVRGNERWLFPARVRVAADGTMALLNADELTARADAWLAEMEWPREVCSRWTFSWTAYQIRCDAAAALEAAESYGMQPGRIAEGQPFALKGALGPVVLARTGEADGRVILTGSGPVDPDFLRESEARGALVVAEVSGEKLTPEEAAARAAAITATGTVSVTFEVDAAGMVWRREDVSEYTMTGSQYSDGRTRARTTVTRLPRAEWERQQAEKEAADEAADPMADPNPAAEEEDVS
jgi:hypothetical protein